MSEKNSIVHVFFETAERERNAPALRYKQEDTWRSISWKDYAEYVRNVAKALIALDLEAGDRVIIIGCNRWEWLVSDLGIMAAGGVPTPIYHTCTPEQVAYIVNHSEARIAIVENKEQLDKIIAKKNELPNLKHLILMDKGDGEIVPRKKGLKTFDVFLHSGKRGSKKKLEHRLEGLSLDSLATLIYTSGTTGLPKAVMLSQNNLVFTAQSCIEFFKTRKNEQFLSYLPLSHIAEQMMSIYIPVTLGGTVSLVPSFEKLGEYIREVRPTILFGVPRVFEKIEAKIAETISQAPKPKKILLGAARKIGIDAAMRSQNKKEPPVGYNLADRIVYSKFRKKLGLDRCRFAICGAAPLNHSSRLFYMGIGLPLYETYGLSEVTGPVVLSSPDEWRVRSVGVAIPRTEIKLGADDEILVHGDHVFVGYLKDKKASKDSFDEDGWLKTGDLGAIDDDGFLKVTGRKKDLIVTAGGKNVAPLPIEASLKMIPAVSQAVVVGDRRKYLSALLTLDPERVKNMGSEIEHEVQKGVDEINAGLARFETIKKFKILANEFSVESGELTPTLKLKRNIITKKYKNEIDGLYS